MVSHYSRENRRRRVKKSVCTLIASKNNTNNVRETAKAQGEKIEATVEIPLRCLRHRVYQSPTKRVFCKSFTHQRRQSVTHERKFRRCKHELGEFLSTSEETEENTNNNKLTQIVTLYREHTGQFEPKAYNVKLQACGNSTTFARGILDASKFCADTSALSEHGFETTHEMRMDNGVTRVRCKVRRRG